MLLHNLLEAVISNNWFVQLSKPYDFGYDSNSSGPWSEKQHTAVTVFYAPANKTVTSFLLGLGRGHDAGHYVVIYLLDILRLFEHLRLPV